MQRFKRMKKEKLREMLLEHLMRYPAIRIILKQISDFPKDLWNGDESKIREDTMIMLKGLTWKEPDD